MADETDMAHHCQDAVGALLLAIEERDLHEMEAQVESLRGCLVPVIADTSMQAEQLDALAGFAEEIERALRRMRASAAGEMARIRAVAPLLEHLALGVRAPLTQQ